MEFKETLKAKSDIVNNQLKKYIKEFCVGFNPF